MKKDEASNCSLEYSWPEFLLRLERLTDKIKNSGSEALLIVNGSDGKDNLESNRLMNWLFNGSTFLEGDGSSYLDSIFEESFFLLGPGTFRAFISDKLFDEYKSLFLALKSRSLIIVPSQEIEDDRSEYEKSKFYHFFESTQPFSTISVLLNSSSEGNLKVKEVEQWPLVQAFGLDGELIRYWRRVFYSEEAGSRYGSFSKTALQ